ncbi:hypothetical protein QCE62_07135 [Caballeronia sp. LZ033]|uniref:hypothetical protein n=1 Tax=Caballeronia sp. LZ033 TaxID=3038566 RepID=UPI00285FB268|nr:hypothetical protein [Caballeronia sp. LZ033]MDR5813366.1 hypothetical protein [Caballeronia sp. LZ033]
MANNQVSYELTRTNIIARMNRGTKYTAYQLAAKFKVPTDFIRPRVLELVEEGALVLERTPRNLIFIRPADSQQAQAPVPDEPEMFLSVAAPPAPPDMVGVLTGYARELTSRAELALLERKKR